MRTLCLLVAASSILLAQDAQEIVRRSLELDRKSDENWRNYTWLERQFEQQFDGDGKVKSQTLRTWDVTFQEGSPYRRLVARNDQPLSPQEEQAEQEKLQRSIVDRRNEPKEQRDRRVAEWRRRHEKQREPFEELQDALTYRMAPDEGDAYVIDGTPKPGYKPKSSTAVILTKLKARLWISKRDYHWIKVDAETLDTVSYGALLIRIGKGAHIVLEQARVNNDVWLPTHISLKGSARILLFKNIHALLDYRYSDYKKFQVESRVVSTGEK